MLKLELKVACQLRVDWPPYKKGQRFVIDIISSHERCKSLFVHVCEPWKNKWLPEWAVSLFKFGNTNVDW